MSGDKPDKSYKMEPHEQHEPPSIRALDVCPNCGSPLGGVDLVVCLRCGFDMKTLKVIKTATGEAAKKKEEAEEEAEEAEPLVGRGLGDLWLPGIVAAASIGVLAVGYLAGWGGLFGPEETGETVGFGMRVVGLVKMAMRTAVWTLAGMGGLIVLAHMLKTRLGDRKLAAVRMLAVVGAVSLATLISFSPQMLEWTVQLALQAAGFVVISMGFFGLNVRDASTLLGVAVMAVVALLLVSSAVLWAAPPL